jgi:3alpha(or 20beta)-hydroxysteroid dehydrogenase
MTQLDLTGRAALVTGGAQGLGEGMAHALAEAGAKVVIADIKDDLGAKVAESLGEGHGFVHLDVTDAPPGKPASPPRSTGSAASTSW